jgi:hypothetical protein
LELGARTCEGVKVQQKQNCTYCMSSKVAHVKDVIILNRAKIKGDQELV